jgi:hypothetical protein
MVVQQNETKAALRQPAPWGGSFDIDGVDGGRIHLSQIDRKTFALTSKIFYKGPTGLEDGGLTPEVMRAIRTIDPSLEPDGEVLTDLASVPGPTRWFLGSYGEHTPAVLLHDQLIPAPQQLPGMTDAYADRYLRFMLQDLGVRWLKRWVMWAAVALRTRWAAKGWRRVSVVVWIISALAGMATFVVAALTGSTGWLIVSVFAPVVFAGLWSRQYGAGVIAALAAPWLLPPTVLAALGYLVYVALEFVFGRFVSNARRGSGTYLPEGM